MIAGWKLSTDRWLTAVTQIFTVMKEGPKGVICRADTIYWNINMFIDINLSVYHYEMPSISIFLHSKSY